MNIDRLKLKHTAKDAAFWVAILPLAASLHPDARDFLAERWELVLVLLGYLAHNGYLRGKVIGGAAEAMVYGPAEVDLDEIMPVHEPMPHPGMEAPDGE